MMSKLFSSFNHNSWLKIAGVSGASAVLLGAIGSLYMLSINFLLCYISNCIYTIGAHALKSHSEVMKDTWKTASSYHFLHTLILTVVATSSSSVLSPYKKNVVCMLFSSGMLLFCGSLYVVVYMNERKPYSYPAPFGGIILTAGWLAMAFL